MKILVCMKQVVDRSQNLRIDDDKKDIVRDNLTLVENDFDKYAVEVALQVRDKVGGEVVVLTAGPPKSSEAMRKALAMGADRAIHIESDQLVKADSTVIAHLMAKAVKEESFELILMGMQSADMAYAQTGPMVAHLLGMPHATTAVAVEVEEGKVRLKRELEGGILEEVELPLPALVTVQTGINKPRYPTMPAIMKARRKPVQKYTPEELLGEDWLSRRQSEVVELFYPPKKEGGKILEGSSDEVVEELVRIFREELKIL